MCIHKNVIYAPTKVAVVQPLMALIVDLTTCERGGAAQPIQFTSDNCHIADAPVFIANLWVDHLEDLQCC